MKILDIFPFFFSLFLKTEAEFELFKLVCSKDTVGNLVIVF